ncbi:hypothetical protein NDU88_009414 [Pleurodeles waltl]|uniref:Uncharacterized protein n=1 Tax=Pleurodeles waltl TaxID=8319 RepID=A0AAV7RV59_PLEWA|nr:hypothetical protein NDU88_009414 [Pleurodeles waltl]
MRTFVTSYRTAHRRHMTAALEDLEAQLAELETQYLTSLYVASLCSSLPFSTVLPQTQIEEARVDWVATQSRIYQWGNKSSKTLHWLCSTELSQDTIPEISDALGHLLTGDSQIAKTFAEYYKELYSCRDEEGVLLIE